ncbi:hypothetical protein MTO96_036809 [Rhipicephalus appendiculatus]
MVGSSKKRKSSLRGSSPQRRDRRVCFDVPSVGESTTHLDRPPAAPILQPATGVPPAAPYPYRGDDAPWNQNSPYYGPIGAPMHSSTAALFGSRLTTTTNPFVEQAVTAHGSYWVRPPLLGSRWPQTIRPFFQPEVVSEVSEDDDGDAKAAPHQRSGGNEKERDQASDTEFTQTTQGEQPPASVASRTEESRKHYDEAADYRRDEYVAAWFQSNASATVQWSLLHLLHHCTTAMREYYYSTTSHACLSTEVDGVHLCNHGSNRFPSLLSCLATCAHEGREPRDRCYEDALFGACTR